MNIKLILGGVEINGIPYYIGQQLILETTSKYDPLTIVTGTLCFGYYSDGEGFNNNGHIGFYVLISNNENYVNPTLADVLEGFEWRLK